MRSQAGQPEGKGGQEEEEYFIVGPFPDATNKGVWIEFEYNPGSGSRNYEIQLEDPLPANTQLKVFVRDAQDLGEVRDAHDPEMFIGA